MKSAVIKLYVLTVIWLSLNIIIYPTLKLSLEKASDAEQNCILICSQQKQQTGNVSRKNVLSSTQDSA